jgi:MFS family permease
LAFNASPFEMGVLNALGNLAYPFLGLFAGVWVDRWRRKPVLIWTNIVQVIALGSIPVAFLLRILSLYQLFLVTLVMGVTIVFFDVAYTAYLPTLIDRRDLVEGNSKLETSASSSAVVGPALAGAIIQILGAALSIAADAAGTLIAAMAILSIREPEPRPAAKAQRHFLSELQAGLRSVTDIPPLRTLVGANSIFNVGYNMFYAVFFLFIYNELKLSPGLAGIILSVGAVGFIIGALSAPTLLKRIGLKGALVVAALINGVGLLLVPASLYGAAPILLSSIWLFTNIGTPIYNINQVSFRQAIVPDELQGRMNATMRTFGYGAATAGALIGGTLGSMYGIIPVMVGGAIITLLPILLIQLGTFGRLNDTQQTGTQVKDRS